MGDWRGNWGDFWMCGLVDVRIGGCADVRMCEFFDVQMRGCGDWWKTDQREGNCLWQSGRINGRDGFFDVWMCGFIGPVIVIESPLKVIL